MAARRWARYASGSEMTVPWKREGGSRRSEFRQPGLIIISWLSGNRVTCVSGGRRPWSRKKVKFSPKDYVYLDLSSYVNIRHFGCPVGLSGDGRNSVSNDWPIFQSQSLFFCFLFFWRHFAAEDGESVQQEETGGRIEHPLYNTRHVNRNTVEFTA